MEKDISYSPNKLSSENNTGSKSSGGYASVLAPQISLPTRGGSIRSIEESFRRMRRMARMAAVFFSLLRFPQRVYARHGTGT